jgi:hypothetical protein
MLRNKNKNQGVLDENTGGLRIFDVPLRQNFKLKAI